MNTRILAIDPGLRHTGYALLCVRDRVPELVEGGLLNTKSGLPLEERLSSLYDSLTALIAETSPDVVVVEDLYTKYEHPATAVKMAHARGVSLLAAARCGCTVMGYPPARAKKALTGNGAATKLQVRRAVCAALRLETVPRSHHVTDAIALALCHANTLGRNLGNR